MSQKSSSDDGYAAAPSANTALADSAPIPASGSKEDSKGRHQDSNPKQTVTNSNNRTTRQHDVWTSFSENRQWLDCEQLESRSQRWLRHYKQQELALRTDLQRALPLIVLASNELKRRGLPSLFAMLPMVESQYYAHRSQGNRPAGIWQLMPQTARGLSVPMRPDYDGRLDYDRSTTAAAQLLEHLYREFNGDWRLVNMAFNAGEFRVKSALKKNPREPDKFDTLGLSKITLHHLAKLEALTCLIAEPAKHDFSLPDPSAAITLTALPIPSRVHVDFLAHVADIDLRVLRRWNPALRSPITPDIPFLNVLLPNENAQQANAMLGEIATAQWSRIRPQTFQSAEKRKRMLAGYDEADRWVATLNAASERADRGVLWLPSATSKNMSIARASAASKDVHVIKIGDTLWDIARHYGVVLNSLMSWNGLNTRSVLRPGQRLRLSPP